MRRKFLLVDDDPYLRFLVSSTLLRHYPDALVQECQVMSIALELARAKTGDDSTVIIVRRPLEADGLAFVQKLRDVNTTIPIVWMGESGHSHLAQAIPGVRFLEKDAWLLVGQVVANLAPAT